MDQRENGDQYIFLCVCVLHKSKISYLMYCGFAQTNYYIYIYHVLSFKKQ